MRGFTLVETLILVTVVGIVLAVGLPLLASVTEQARLDAAASEIDAALAYARYSAAATGRATRVTVDAQDDVLVLEQQQFAADFRDGTKTEVDATLADSLVYVPMSNPQKPGKVYRIDLAKDLRMVGVDITSASFGSGAGTNVVDFSPTGTPSAQGSVVLQAGGSAVEVTVNAVSNVISHLL